MASWWMPWPQLQALRRIANGEAMTRRASDIGFGYWWQDTRAGCTPQGRALEKKGFISAHVSYHGKVTMRLTPTGRNELNYHAALTEEHYKK